MSIFSDVFASGFDSSTVEPKGDYAAIPAGQYVAGIEKVEVKPTSAGTGHYLSIQHNILEGPMAGRKLFGNINIINPSQQAQEIGQRQLSALCRACGIVVLKDEKELLGKTVAVRVKVKMTKDTAGNVLDEKNEITTWSANIPRQFLLPPDPAAPSGPENTQMPSGVKPPWAR